MGQGERRMLVEQFLEGLPYSESSTLKLVATDSEMLDVDQLALRASRSGKPKQAVTAISTPKPKVTPPTEPKPPSDGKQQVDRPRRRGARFNCHYCGKFGHGWRACFKRARENPNWVPETRVNSQKTTPAQHAQK